LKFSSNICFLKIIDPTQMSAMVMINSSEQKIDLELGDLSVNIDPILIRTFASLTGSIKKQEVDNRFLLNSFILTFFI